MKKTLIDLHLSAANSRIYMRIVVDRRANICKYNVRVVVESVANTKKYVRFAFGSPARHRHRGPRSCFSHILSQFNYFSSWFRESLPHNMAFSYYVV